ncbi:14481_t:CDS:2, partial [Funneliformis geosporum]
SRRFSLNSERSSVFLWKPRTSGNKPQLLIASTQISTDILARSKFSAKLAGLPRFTNGKQLNDIGHMVNALSW